MNTLENYYTYITYSADNIFESIGVTNSLQRRLKLLNQLQQNTKVKLVYFEEYADSKTATERELFLKQLQSKIRRDLVLENNPMLIDLIEEV